MPELMKLTASEQAALNEAITAICCKDWDDYKKSLYKIVSILAGQEAADLLETDATEAYGKYIKQ